MGLTSALYTGLSGLVANSELMSVTGNNISNVNTTGYKASSLSFETQISQQLTQGSAPTSDMGGTNPTEIGLGVQIGGTTRNFSSGNVTPTGVNSDVAIQNNGFLVMNYGTYTRYSRDGNLSLDQNFNLVNSTGGKVQGYGIDSNFNVVDGALQDINIPVGVMTLAQATQNVTLGGNLNAGGTVATQGTLITSGELHSAAGSAAGVNDASATTSLTSLYATGGSTPLFNTGDVITVSGATKGSTTLTTHTFRVDTSAGTPPADAYGTTLGDFTNFLQNALGIDTSVGGAGVTVSGGQITVTGNSGTANDLVLNSGNVLDNAGSSPSQPFTFSKAQAANGESVATSFVAYDSLGNPLNIDVTAVLTNKDNTGTQWEFYVQSDQNTGPSRVVSEGTLSFDTNGQLTGSTGSSFSIYRDGTGALSPQPITLKFSNQNGALSALTDTASNLTSLSQDGSPIGTLQDYSIGSDGTIMGKFSNSLMRPLGQIVLATFTNPQGLVDNGTNLYSSSVNSGTAQVHTPGSGGAGTLVGSALELSNVDLSQEFINLISASTGFSASSRVLTTSNQMIQQLMATIQ